MSKLTIDLSNIYDFVTSKQVFAYKEELMRNQELLEEKTGKGNDFLGWLNLPSSTSKEELKAINEVAADLRSKSEIVVVVGIGGSYLGARAVIDGLSNSFDHLQTNRKSPVILYAGQNIGEDYTYELLEFLKNKSFAIVIISKSGTTTEPAIAFRLLKELIETQYSKSEAKERIIAIPDASKGALKT